MREFSSRSHVVFSEGDDPGVDVVAHARTMRASRQIRASARLRILGWIMALTTLAVVGSLLLARRLLMERLDSEVSDALAQEIEEMTQLAAGNDPATGRPFGNDVEAIFDTFLRRNVPEEGDAFFTFVDAAPFKRSPAPVALEELPQVRGRWAGLTAPDRGELGTEAGRVRWEAIPLQDDAGHTVGVFAVANFVEAERQEIADADQHCADGGGGHPAAGSRRRLDRGGPDPAPGPPGHRHRARAIGETDLSGRIEVEGRDEVADLARTFNAMLDRLETAFATQRAFVDDAGHELRTPITIVRGHLELLDDDPDERRRTVDLVTDELDRMSRIVDDLLLLAKLERPDFLRVEPLDVEPFTHELFAKAQAFDRRDWRLAGYGDGRVVADGQRITQAVMNLARNAVEHAGHDATITIGSQRRDGEVSFWVRDTGPGVAPDDQSAIFERFARRGDRRRSDGAGLGLAIVRAVAEAHGGHVDLDSRPGAGACFTVTIPLGDATHHRHGRSPVARILIAEDEPRIASFLEKGLRANGFATTVVDDGVVAEGMARDGDFELLILDLGLPNRHGLDVLRALRRRGERLPVVILTARDEVEITVAGFDGGADDYVTKPFRFEELLARIRVRLRADSTEETTLLRAGEVTLDLRTRRATVAGRSVELTGREFALAETFLRHTDQVLSREQLLSHVWGYDFDPESNVVDVYVRYLRLKLGVDVIETVRGMGYRLTG